MEVAVANFDAFDSGVRTLNSVVREERQFLVNPAEKTRAPLHAYISQSLLFSPHYLVFAPPHLIFGREA